MNELMKERSGQVTEERSGPVAQWPSGRVAEERSGPVAQWPSSQVTESEDSKSDGLNRGFSHEIRNSTSKILEPAPSFWAREARHQIQQANECRQLAEALMADGDEDFAPNLMDLADYWLERAEKSMAHAQALAA